MAAGYYPGFGVGTIDTDGNFVPLGSAVLDVEDITTSTSLGTVSADSDGYVAEGSHGAAPGDVVEYSHGSYPLKFRQTLTTTQDEAYLHPENSTLRYILENNYASAEESKFARVYLEDNGDPTQKPIYLGVGIPGDNKFPFQSSIAKSMKVRLVSIANSGAQDTADLAYSQSDDVSVPALAPGTVTSVAMTVPGFLSVSGSPITGSGTFAVSLVSQAANRVFASPNGSSGVPTFRALVAADIPTIPITIGTTPIASGTNGRFVYQASGVASQTPRLSYDGTSVVVGDTASRTSTEIVFKTQADGGFGNFTLFEQKAAGDVTFRDRFNVSVFGYNSASEIWSSSKTFEIAEVRSSSRYLTPKILGYNDNNRELNIDQAGIAFRLTDASNNAKLLQMYSQAATAQLEVGYNTSNYYKTTVDSTGTVTFDAVGSDPKFKFNGSNVLVGAPGWSTERLNISGGIRFSSSSASWCGVTMQAVTDGSNTLIQFVSPTVGISVIPLARLVGTTYGSTNQYIRLDGNGIEYKGYTAGYGSSPNYSAHYFDTDIVLTAGTRIAEFANDSTSKAFFQDDGSLGIGLGGNTVSAGIDVRRTTEQMRLAYDGSNDARFTVNSAGTLTINNVGSTPKTAFSDAVEVASGGIFGPMIADAASVYIDGPGGVYFDNDMTPRVALGDWNANGQGTQLIVDDNDQTISRNVGSGGEFAYIGGKLFQHFTDATTSGTTQQNLYTFTLPAGSLTQNGDTIKCEYGGIFTANTNTKRIFPKFAGVVLATGQVAAAGATDWTVDFYLIRVSNTVVRYVVEFTSTGETPTIESGELTGLNLTTTAYNIDLDGRTVTSAGELTAQSGKAIFHPAAA